MVNQKIIHRKLQSSFPKKNQTNIWQSDLKSVCIPSILWGTPPYLRETIMRPSVYKQIPKSFEVCLCPIGGIHLIAWINYDARKIQLIALGSSLPWSYHSSFGGAWISQLFSEVSPIRIILWNVRRTWPICSIPAGISRSLRSTCSSNTFGKRSSTLCWKLDAVTSGP